MLIHEHLSGRCEAQCYCVSMVMLARTKRIAKIFLFWLTFAHSKKKNMEDYNVTTLGQFIIEKQHEFPMAKGELSRLLRDIGIAAKIISREVNKAGLGEILGDHGSVNVQGEDVKKLDIIGNEMFMWAFRKGGEGCVMASEKDMMPLSGSFSKSGKYVLCIDPLDGSSNIDVNVSIGTIFSIYRRISEPGSDPTLEDVLQPGNKLVAAGYVVYGT